MLHMSRGHHGIVIWAQQPFAGAISRVARAQTQLAIHEALGAHRQSTSSRLMSDPCAMPDKRPCPTWLQAITFWQPSGTMSIATCSQAPALRNHMHLQDRVETFCRQRCSAIFWLAFDVHDCRGTISRGLHEAQVTLKNMNKHTYKQPCRHEVTRIHGSKGWGLARQGMHYRAFRQNIAWQPSTSTHHELEVQAASTPRFKLATLAAI